MSPAASVSSRGVAHKRSLQACLACRSRKVRCDVSRRGQPCTNCDLDSKTCLLVARASGMSHPRNRLNRQRLSETNSADTLVEAEETVPETLEPASASASAPAPPPSSITDDVALLGFGDASAPSEYRAARVSSGIESEFQPQLLASSRPTDVNSRDPAFMRQVKQNASFKPTVLHSYYQFITIGNLHKIPSNDVSFLEAQGCLHVPTRPILDRFVEQYFTHIHVFLPLFNEGDFWAMYSEADSCASSDKISLLVFQAVLFISCGFVSQEGIETLGFSSHREARASFYRKAKLLYDLETETSSLSLAQAALLLMDWVPPSNMSLSPYKTWLGRAIQHARSINADRYARKPSKRHSRTHPLSVKPRTHSDVYGGVASSWIACVRSSSDPLSLVDLEDEIYRSRVTTPAAKRRQLALFCRFLELTIVMTDVLSLAFPFEDSAESRRSSSGDDDLDIEKSEKTMRDWYAQTLGRFPPYGSSTNQQLGINSDAEKPLILYTNLMYIYYHTAEIALCHYKIFRQSIAAGSVKPRAEAIQQRDLLKTSRCELQDAVVKVTQYYGELTKRRIARWLPISAVGCIAMPLALHAVSARLSSLCSELALDPQSTETLWTSISNQNRLDVLVETMQALFPQYYGVEWVKETARHAANLAQNDSQHLSRSSHVSITDWSQILENQPDCYLRMSWTVDLCISKGRLPEENDFPTWLRGRLSPQQEQHPQNILSEMDATTMVGTSLSCDINHIFGIVPRLSESSQDPRQPEQDNTISHSDGNSATRFGLPEDWMGFKSVFTEGGSPGVNLDGMEWTLFEAI